jgi:TonB family protein
MNTLLVYMLKAAIYLAAFYLLYSILLSRDTSYARNRIFIILSLVMAMVLPALTLQSINPVNARFFGRLLPEVLIKPASAGPENFFSGLSAGTTFQILNIVYISGVIIFLLRFMSELFNLLFLIGRGKNEGTRIIKFHTFNTSGFSAMGYIFINDRLSREEADEIIKHEENHLKCNHFIDIIIIELIKAFQWFNPTVHLFNRSIRAIHEYQADMECLTAGTPVANYQSLLLNQVFRTGSFNLTNSFSNPSLVRKRMVMMTKKRTSSLASIKLLFVIPVAGFLFLSLSLIKNSEKFTENQITVSPAQQQTSVSANDVSEKSDEVPFVQVEEMPMFPGGDAALLRYIGENTTYPENAKKNNIAGRVVLRFCVTAKGNINKISVLKGIDPELDAEAIRVVSTLPAFKPGRQDGKDVPVWYMVPITFTLK